MERRNFLKLLGASLGTVMVAGCGSDSSSPLPAGGGAQPLAPVGYRFLPVLEVGGALPGGRRVASLPRLVQTYDEGLVFHALDDQGRRGIYRARVDLTTGQPRLADLQPLVRQGDVLANGAVVSRLDHRGDVSPEGNYAAVVGFPDGSEGVVLANGSSLRAVALNQDPVGSLPATRFGSSFSHLSLHRGDELLLTCHIGSRTPARVTQGVVHLPASRAEGATVVTRAGETPAGMTVPLTALGLVNLGNGGRFLLQGFTGGGRAGEAMPALVLEGQMGSASVPVSHHPSFGSSSPLPTGTVLSGPRRLGDGSGFVIHPTPHTAELVVNGQVVARTGDVSPSSHLIAGFFPPALGAAGTLLFQALTGTTRRSTELVMQDAYGGRSTLLQAGDAVQGRTLRNFYFGYCSEQANARGVLAFTAEFSDGAQALLVGGPL